MYNDFIHRYSTVRRIGGATLLPPSVSTFIVLLHNSNRGHITQNTALYRGTRKKGERGDHRKNKGEEQGNTHAI
jgi:hypothetical protein